MDINSFSLASKAASDLTKIKTDMGSAVKGSYASVKARLDNLDTNVELAYSLTNNAIINNAINIMKANERLNVIAKNNKYNMEQMIFDDLFDLSGIQTSASTGYLHDAVAGTIRGTTIQTKSISIGTGKRHLIIDVSIVNGTTVNKIEVSFDNGGFKEVPNSTLFEIPKSDVQASSMILRFSLGSAQVMNCYSILWA